MPEYFIWEFFDDIFLTTTDEHQLQIDYDYIAQIIDWYGMGALSP